MGFPEDGVQWGREGLGIERALGLGVVRGRGWPRLSSRGVGRGTNGLRSRGTEGFTVRDKKFRLRNESLNHTWRTGAGTSGSCLMPDGWYCPEALGPLEQEPGARRPGSCSWSSNCSCTTQTSRSMDWARVWGRLISRGFRQRHLLRSSCLHLLRTY